MEFDQIKIILYMLIISTGVDFILPWPILTEKSPSNRDPQPESIGWPRSSRQVVQPKWLNFQNEPIIDPTVYVNPKALLEADIIRKSIQDAVRHDYYAVTGEQTNPNFPLVTAQPIPSFKPSADEMNNPYALPAWYQQMQILWQNWSQGLLRGFRT